MKYCVIKDTTTVIDGSNNPVEIMLQNAQNTGFTENEVEILAEEEYEARKELEPVPPQSKTELELLQEQNEKLKVEMAEAKQIASETSFTQQELIELLIEMGVM